MSQIKETSELENLTYVLASIDDAKAVVKLLEDLFTEREIRDLASRLQVARMLDSGISYVEIEKATGVSATTIARVSKCLNSGSGGYKIALDILNESN